MLIAAVVGAAILAGCTESLPWPEPPLLTFPERDSTWEPPADIEAAMDAIVGRYAHYDVVSYEDPNTRVTMRTFVVSYGFTEFYIEDGRLYESDRFCHAEQKMNNPNVSPSFSDEAVQAILPRVQEVELRFEDGEWRIHRPPSPTLLGISGDPGQPLSRDPDDPNIVDADGDGNPGVTVELAIGKVMRGEIYITRREIYSYDLTLKSDGNLYGNVTDASEQFVVDASMRTLRQQSEPFQLPDPGMNPIVLVRVGDEISTCEDLRENRDLLFPNEPEFY